MGLLDDKNQMTPQQLGLLYTGLGILANSRGRSLGEAIGLGGMQGVQGMQQAQEAQMQNMAYQQKLLQAQREQQQLEAAKAIDWSGKPSDIAKALATAGDISSAAKVYNQGNKPDRAGVPTGFTANPDGSIAPMPIAGGKNYMDYQLQLVNQKAQIPGYGEAERLGMARSADARASAAEERANRADARAEEASKRAMFKEVPAAQQTAYLGNTAAMQKIDEAIAALEANPSALGIDNILGDTISQRLDPKGVPVRAKIADIGGVKLHDLSGAAISPSESKRLMPMIPTATDSKEAAIDKLRQLRREAEIVNEQIGIAFSPQNGYRSAFAAPSTPAVPAQPQAEQQGYVSPSTGAAYNFANPSDGLRAARAAKDKDAITYFSKLSVGVKPEETKSQPKIIKFDAQGKRIE